jgi:hypothetical protein
VFSNTFELLSRGETTVEENDECSAWIADGGVAIRVGVERSSEAPETGGRSSEGKDVRRIFSDGGNIVLLV